MKQMYNPGPSLEFQVYKVISLITPTYDEMEDFMSQGIQNLHFLNNLYTWLVGIQIYFKKCKIQHYSRSANIVA